MNLEEYETQKKIRIQAFYNTNFYLSYKNKLLDSLIIRSSNSGSFTSPGIYSAFIENFFLRLFLKFISFFSFREIRSKFTPLAAKFSAIALPIPALAPVMIADLFFIDLYTIL